MHTSNCGIVSILLQIICVNLIVLKLFLINLTLTDFYLRSLTVKVISYLIVIINLYKFDCIIALVSYNLKWLSDPKPVDTQCFGGFQCFTHVISYKLFMYCHVIYITVYMLIFQVK